MISEKNSKKFKKGIDPRAWGRLGSPPRRTTRHRATECRSWHTSPVGFFVPSESGKFFDSVICLFGRKPESKRKKNELCAARI